MADPVYQGIWDGKQIDLAIGKIINNEIVGPAENAAERAAQSATQAADSANASAGSAQAAEAAKTAVMGMGADALSVSPETPASVEKVVSPDGAVTLKFSIPKGLTGSQGPRGDRGERGEKGETGDTGPRGEKGLTGDTGPQGERGPTGETGPQGPKGDTGDTGPQGEQGVIGPQGPKGDPGKDGTSLHIEDTYPTLQALQEAFPTGNANMYLVEETGECYIWSETQNGWYSVGKLQGPPGPEGVQGPPGEQGIQGIEGKPGPKGETGSVGPVGPPGETGPAGPTGPQGETGPAGKTPVKGVDYDTPEDRAEVEAAVLDKAVAKTAVGKASGVASLGSDGKVPAGQLPAMDYIPTTPGTDGQFAVSDGAGGIKFITLADLDKGVY